MRLATIFSASQFTAFAECETFFFHAQNEPLPYYFATNPPPMPEQPWDAYSRLSCGVPPNTKRRTIPYPVPERNCPKKVLVTAKHFLRTSSRAMSPRIWKEVIPNKSYKNMIAVYGERAWRKRLQQIQASKTRQRQAREESMCGWVYQEEAVRHYWRLQEEYRLRHEAEVRKAHKLEQERRCQEQEEARQRQLQQEKADQEAQRRQEEEARQQKIRQEQLAEAEKKRRAEQALQEQKRPKGAEIEAKDLQEPGSQKSEGEVLTGEALERWQIMIIEQTMKEAHQSRELANLLDAALSGF